MIEEHWPLVAALVVGFLTWLFAKKTRPPKAPEKPDSSTAIGVASETIQQTFEEEVKGIWKDVEGDDPAGDLADKGNSRRRR
tara:strand:- start:661 stop:906 length:246 start_codon:yes stop_codon:yes gene_type:complete